MYKIRAAILTFFLATLLLQAQEGFYYQAVIKNPDGSPLKEAQVEVKISIVTNTTSLYTEQQSIVTSKVGFISFIIGNNNPATFSNINWNQELFLEDQIDINDGQGFSTPSRIPLLKSPRSYISDRAISVLDNSITSASISDGSISNDDISATAEISFSKLSVSAPDIESLGFIQSDENFTTALKTKLDGIQDEANAYSLPTATSDVLGGVKVGAGITITDGVISADTQSDTNFTTALKTKLDGIQDEANAYSLPTATSDVLGGVKVGAGITITDGVISADTQSDTNFTTALKTKLDGIQDEANAYSLPTATSDVLGGVKVGAGITITDGVISADTQSDTNFTTALKTKLDGIQDEANAYSLPTATSDVLGGVKVGTGITITDGVISADTQSDTNFTTALKTKLDGIQDEANAYSLPTATSDVLGGVKVGTGITITDGVISADTQSDTNFTTALKTKLDGIQDEANAYSLPTATSDVLGGVKVGTGITITDGVISADTQSDTNFTTALKTKLDGIQDEANAYSLPTATSDVLGGVKVGTGITITDGVIAIGQAVGTSNDVSFNSVSSSLTGNVTGNVTGEILSLDGTSILDNGTDGTDATFTGNSATATTLSSTLPINLGGTGSTIAPMIGIITAADESTARTQLNILSDTFTWLLSDNATQSKTVPVTGLTSTSIVTVTPNSNINPQTFYIEPNTGSFTIYSSGNLNNGTTFSYIAIIKNE